MGKPGAHRVQQWSEVGQNAGWQDHQPYQRTKSPRARNRPKSRKKKQDSYWNANDPYSGAPANQMTASWPASSPWSNSTASTDPKGFGKGFAPVPMQVASPPPPPPPLLMTPAALGVPWMPQGNLGGSPAPFMPPPVDSSLLMPHPSTAMHPPGVPSAASPKQENSAQQKLLRIVKAAKKEDNLSAEFQELVHAEMKKDDKESTNDLLDAVREHGRAKEALLAVENARRQLWSQWRLFLQQSVIKWKEYTAQFQTSEVSFQTQMHEATVNLRRTQRRVDVAKKRAVALGTEEAITVPSEDDMDETEPKEDGELPRDENAQKIAEGLHQVVSSLAELSESADRLEPKPKRPRKDPAEVAEALPGTTALPSMQPFGKADAA